MAGRPRAAAYSLKKRDVPQLVTELAKILHVYGPVAYGSQFRFEPLQEASQLRLDYSSTILPPKKYFIPPVQETLTFALSPKLEIKEPTQEKPTSSWPGKSFLLFGVHSCDLAGISFNDLMYTLLYQDPFPLRRRKEAVIIGLHCLAPCPDSFCRSMGSLNWTQSADLMLTDLGEEYYVQVLTDAGQRVVDQGKKLFLPGTDAQAAKAKKILKDREQQFPDPVKESSKLPEQLDAHYEGAMWERIGKLCLGCGNCTNACPTCFCFDVNDRVDLSLTKGARLRSWDSCQLADFALVAGGQNFRPTIASRLRFRIYHKFRVEPEQVKQIGCVGCGRCTRFCPADIDMIELLTDIQKGGN